MPVNAAHPASCTDFASRVQARPCTARSSTVTAWFSRMIAVESLWWKSRRASATCACTCATRARDQRTATSPTFGSRSFPFSSTANRLFFVNRTDCRASLRDRNRGGPTFGPFRFWAGAG